MSETPLDPENPIVKLCAQGMQAEFQHRYDEARAFFHQAWEAHRDDFEACIAAHYVARHQDSLADSLHWNEEALRRADAVGNERVHAFYPSLYLNLGHSYELLGRREPARRYYDLAAEWAAELPAGPYGDMTRGGIAAALERMQDAGE